MQESHHKLVRDICHGKRGTIHQAYRDGMEDQLGALGLVLNAVVLWTTRYLDAAVAQLRAEGHEIRDEDIARLSPLKHKNLTAVLSHAELEDELDRRGRELLRQMFQGQLDLRAVRERRADEVTDADACATARSRPGTPARSRRSSARSRSPDWPIAAAATPTSIRRTGS